MQLSTFTLSPLSIRSKTLMAATFGMLLLSNNVLAESYQSFSSFGYENQESTFTTSNNSFYSKNNRDSFGLSSIYYFDERKTLGPLSEFDYINTSSNLFASLSNSDNDGVTSINGDSSLYNTNSNNVNIGGQWITHNFIVGASYSHASSEVKGDNGTFDLSDNTYSASLGYFISDDFVISANYSDGGRADDYFSYGAKYNLLLEGTDYIGFSYNVDEDFDTHQLSSRYFMGLTDDSYLVLGGNYTIDNRDAIDDTWSVNTSYYFNSKTSISVSYGDDDFYSVGARYFISSNYSVRAGYNSVANGKDKDELEGYNLSFSAQF